MHCGACPDAPRARQAGRLCQWGSGMASAGRQAGLRTRHHRSSGENPERLAVASARLRGAQRRLQCSVSRRYTCILLICLKNVMDSMLSITDASQQHVHVFTKFHRLTRMKAHCQNMLSRWIHTVALEPS